MIRTMMQVSGIEIVETAIGIIDTRRHVTVEPCRRNRADVLSDEAAATTDRPRTGTKTAIVAPNTTTIGGSTGKNTSMNGACAANTIGVTIMIRTGKAIVTARNIIDEMKEMIGVIGMIEVIETDIAIVVITTIEAIEEVVVRVLKRSLWTSPTAGGTSETVSLTGVLCSMRITGDRLVRRLVRGVITSATLWRLC